MYKVGDKVVYPHHGAGTVVKKEVREVLGEKREYMTIQIAHNDMVVNVTELKPLTNMRASGSDSKAVVKPPKIFSMEMALEFIEDDELVEITPKAVRMRKIWLKEGDRKKLAEFCFKQVSLGVQAANSGRYELLPRLA